MRSDLSKTHVLSEYKTKKRVRPGLRLLQTFAGVLQEKIRTPAVFKKTNTNYISIERL